MRNTLLIIMLTFFIVSGCEDENHKGDNIGELDCNYTEFRWYNDEMLPVGEMSNDFILIGTDTSYSNSAISNFVASIDYFDNAHHFEINDADIDHMYAFKYIAVKLVKSCNCGEIAWVINELISHSIVSFAHYCTKTQNCENDVWESIGEKCVDTYSSLFYIKVIDENDLSDLYAVAEETNTTVLLSSPLMPKWFTLTADKNSAGDAMQMSNYFYETGLFGSSSPDIIKMAVD